MQKLENPPHLINVNIRREDAQELRMMKRYHEPLYSIIHRVLSARNIDVLDLTEVYEQQKEATQAWMKRALDAEAKLNKVQRTLF